MRVVHVIDSLEPARGGPPVVVTRLSAAQASLGNSVSVVSYCPPEQRDTVSAFYQHVPGRDNVAFKFLTPDWYRYSYALTGSSLSTALERADMLHLHGVWEPLLVAAADYARAMGIPYVVRPCGMLDPWSLKQKMMKKRLAMMLGCRKMLDHAAFIHALNRDENNLLKPLHLKSPTKVIPNGIFLEEVSPLPAPGAFRAKVPGLRGRPYILFLSRLHFKKGLDYLADAFQLIVRRNPDVQLVVAGPDGGALAPFMRQVEQLGLRDRVHLVGPQYGNDKIAAMVDSACFCLPSRQEGFSVAIIEALACGIPVVISEACRFPEVEEVGAGIITPLKPRLIAEAVLRVLSDTDLAAAMGRAGREMVLSRFTWPKIAQTTVNAYETAVAQAGDRKITVAQMPIRDDLVTELDQETQPEEVPDQSGPLPNFLNVQEVCATVWWQEFNDIVWQSSPYFVEELRGLITDALPVASVHGGLGVNDPTTAGGVTWILDWRKTGRIGPRRTDEVAQYLSAHRQWIVEYPKYAAHAFLATFLERAQNEERRDVMAAVAFLAAARHDAALAIIRHWDEISSALYTDRATVFDQLRSARSRVEIAIISDSPTPLQLPVLNRLFHEYKECKIHNIFTHRISSRSMPWNMGIPADYLPVFFSEEHLQSDDAIEQRSYSLFRKIRDYLIENNVRVMIANGSSNLTGLLLMNWARKHRIHVLLAGERSVYEPEQKKWLRRLLRRSYYSWIIGRVSGVMPMGTCGRAFYRQFRDHSLPEFLFPYEPDYSQLEPVDQTKLDLFCTKHGLDPARKHFLFYGRLAPSSRADLLIEAFAALASQHPDWDLVIAGDGESQRLLESLVPGSLSSRVRFIGFIQAQEKAACYQACNVLVNPSEHDAWGLEINEAVACGLAVIATSVVGAAVELVRHRTNGLLISPRSVRSLTEAMDEVANGDTSRRMQSASADVLRIWREVGDPVSGLQSAINHFNLLSSRQTPEILIGN